MDRKVKRQSKWQDRAFAAHILAAALATAGVSAVNADVLYDTTDMTTNQTYIASLASLISHYPANPNELWDGQFSDDFVLSGDHTITSIRADFVTPASTYIAEAVLLEIFADSAGTPVEVPTAQVVATLGKGLSVATFDDTIMTGSPFGGFGYSYTIDLSAANVQLGAGTWWASVVVVDEEAPFEPYHTWVLSIKAASGGGVHFRNGGIDHGNGYLQVYGCSEYDWVITSICPEFPEFGLAMRVEGTPAPQGCPADIAPSGGDGVVNVADLLALISNWGAGAGNLADLNGDGIVNIADLLALISAWGDCP